MVARPQTITAHLYHPVFAPSFFLSLSAPHTLRKKEGGFSGRNETNRFNSSPHSREDSIGRGRNRFAPRQQRTVINGQQTVVVVVFSALVKTGKLNPMFPRYIVKEHSGRNGTGSDQLLLTSCVRELIVPVVIQFSLTLFLHANQFYV